MLVTVFALLGPLRRRPCHSIFLRWILRAAVLMLCTFAATVCQCSLDGGGVAALDASLDESDKRVRGGVPSMSDVMTSRAVSEAAQKNGGDSHHLIWRLLGTTIWVSSRVCVGSSLGRM